tara:strand:- start:82 stop:312 length:231 start_codon:yes stop_codon:yes gene_type:complete
MAYNSKEKKAEANKRYKATPEGREKVRASVKRFQLRQRIKDLENRITEEGIVKYKQTIQNKIDETKEKLRGVEVKA